MSDEHHQVDSIRERQTFQAARIDHTALKTDPTGAILASARHLAAQRGHVGDLILIMGPPGSPKLFDRAMEFLEKESKK
jgi:hypothetical protein